MSNNQVTLGQKLKSYKRTPFSFLVMLLVLLSAVITFAVLIFLIAYVLINDHDTFVTIDRCSLRNFFCYFPCRICRKRK